MDGRLLFGRLLKGLREEQGILQRQVGDALGYSESTIRHVEAGRRTPPDDLGQLADRYFRVPGRLLARAAGEARSDTTPFGELKEHEQRASRIRIWENRLIPGLLQTPDYARAVLGADDLVTERLDRQKILHTDHAPTLRAVIDESVLYRQVGTREIMRTQLHHLTNTDNPWDIHVLPISKGVHGVTGGPLTLLEFDGDAPVAFTDSLRNSSVVDLPADVAELHHAYESVLGLALSPDASAEMIRSKADDLPEGC